MTLTPSPPVKDEIERLVDEIERLVRELTSAEAYEQKLRQRIVDTRETLAAGDVPRALSMLNDLLRIIDDQTDVVAPGDAGLG